MFQGNEGATSSTIEDTGRPVRTKQVGRNESCPCGSGRKYKKCCLLKEHREKSPTLPRWIMDSERRLYQYERYTTKVYGVPHILKSLRDGRRNPDSDKSTFHVVNSLYHAALFRRPSINALEGDLKNADFQRVLGREPKPEEKAFSWEVIGNTLDKLELKGLRDGNEDVINAAERNKALREGYATLRCVAIDGWEPFKSYDRCCSHCLTREVPVKNPTSGKVEKRTQYYHSYVVAMLVDPVLDLVLGIEQVLNSDKRPGDEPRHEGELTAGYRLIDRLHETFGTLIDVFIMDALYANGPVMTKLDKYGYGGFIVLKKNNNEPLKEALALMEGQKPCTQFYDEDKKENVEIWDVDDIETLSTYKGKVRVIRAVITKKDGSRKTWCFGMVGRARKVHRRQALTIIRSRWHIEDTGFCQWVKYWNLGRVYRHTANAIQAVLLLWMLVFNLLQLFVYRRLGRKRKPKDPCDTIISIVATMFRDLGSIPEPIYWEMLADAGMG